MKLTGVYKDVPEVAVPEKRERLQIPVEPTVLYTLTETSLKVLEAVNPIPYIAVLEEGGVTVEGLPPEKLPPSTTELT